MSQKKNHIGSRFGRLVVTADADDYINPSGISIRNVLCKCDCGKELIVAVNRLVTKNTSSCGCYKNENTSRLNPLYHTKHGLVYHPLYETYHGMHKRCYYKKHVAYKNYGGRGVTVCDEWNKNIAGTVTGLINFIAWVESSGWFVGCGLTLDRIDNDKGYSPENCRWATKSEQRKNQRPRKAA